MTVILVILIGWLLIKHCICDSVLNTESISSGKRKNGWAGNRNLILHGASHGLLTALCILTLGFIMANFHVMLIAIPVGVLDLFLHTSIDKLKVIVEKYYDVIYRSFAWYIMTLFDQGLHVLSYGLYIYIIYLVLL